MRRKKLQKGVPGKERYVTGFGIVKLFERPIKPRYIEN